MAAPTPTARITPPGIFLKEGYQSLVTIAADPNIDVWEKTITPPGFDGGDAIDNTTMHNTTYRVMRSRSLATMTDMTFVAAYDPIAYDQLLTVLNQETTITVTFPDGSTLAFYGFVRLVESGELNEGDQPEMTITITPTNFDPVNSVEAAAVLTSVAGT